MNHTKKALSFLISIPLLISTLTFSVSAESSFEDFNFEWTDMSTIDDSIIEYMNEEAKIDDPYKYFPITKEDLCGQSYGYSLDYNYLSTSLANYTSGSIKNYLKKSNKQVVFFRKNNYNYDYFINFSKEFPISGDFGYESNQKYTSMLGYFLDGATPFNLKGDVYFISERYIFGVDIAIVEVNNTPKYVVFPDVGHHTFIRSDNETEGEKAILDTYAYLTGDGSIDTDKPHIYQIVLDFDYVVDLCKASDGTLPDDYKYVPKGLEKGMLEKYRSCVSKSEYDGIVYYYNKLGECKGAYTGWAEGSYGKKYYRDGIALTGAHRIDRKKYHFDNNGILIEEKSK